MIEIFTRMRSYTDALMISKAKFIYHEKALYNYLTLS